MKRGKAIAGVALLSLALIGVLAALAQTAEKPPTELYVRTNPAGAKVVVDGKELGTSPMLTEVEPGEHTIVVKLAGHESKTRTVTIREGRIRRVILELRKGTEARDQEPGWGKAVDGVQCRLWAEKPTWPQGTVPKLLVDLRNRGQRNLRIAIESESWEIEIDGKWHRPNTAWSGDRRYLPLGPGTEQQNLEVWIPEVDNLAEKVRALEPGKHTLRVARLINSSTRPREKMLRVVSNPIEIEIVAAKPAVGDEKTAWGPAVEGVQIRLWAEKKTWRVGEEVILKYDARNQGKRDLVIDQPVCFDVFVDHFKYSTDPNVTYGTVPAPFGPGRHYDGRSIGLGAYPGLKLAPGKHTIHVVLTAFQNTSLGPCLELGRLRWDNTYRRWVLKKGYQPPVVVSSNPIEIEIVPAKPAPEAEKTAWGPAVEGVQIRLWVEKKTWRVDEEVILKVDCRNQGKRDLMLDDRTGCFDVYVDHRRYSPDPNTINLSFPAPFGPGRHYNGRPIALGRYPGLKLAPGKHTIRAVLKAAQNTVRPVEGARGGTTMNMDELEAIAQEIEKRRSQPPVVVSSNPIEIEIVAADAAAGAGASGERKLSPRKLFSTSHGAGVLAVAFSPDGLRVAVVDEQAKVVLCDARSGPQLWSCAVLTPDEKKRLLYEDRKGRIHTAAIGFSHDGYTLAVAADPVVRLYDAQSGRLLRTLQDKQLAEKLKDLKRPPATVSRELELLEAVPHAHGRVYSVAFSPDGKLLATSGSHLIRADGSSVINSETATEGKLKLWDAKTGELKRDLGKWYSDVPSVAFSPDGKTLASIGSHPPSWTSSVRLWDPQTGAVQNVHSIHRGGLAYETVAFSPDGKLVAASAFIRQADPDNPGSLRGLPGCNLMVWNARTGERLFNRRTPVLLTSLSFSADGQTLATGVDGQGVILWDAETLTQQGQIELSTKPPRDVQVAFSPVGNLLAVGAKDAKHGFLTVWELGEPGDRPETRPPEEAVRLPAPDDPTEPPATPKSAEPPIPQPPVEQGRDDSTPDSASPDEKDAVAAIKKLGAELKLRSDGTVQSLSFKAAQVTDADLVHLRKLARLDDLDLSGTQISDAGLAHLEGLAGLEELNLRGTRVTNAAVKHLNKLTTVHRLNLENTRVNEDVWRELFLPELYWFGYKGPEMPAVVPRKVLLVEADGAGEKSVLDLASGETLPLSDKAVRDPSVFTRMGKGDFWYGSGRIVCLRGAKAVYIESTTGFLEEKPYRGQADVTAYKLPDSPRVDYVEDGEKKHFYRGRRVWITTAEKKHFLVTIVSVTREDDAVLEYQSADNPFKTKWDPTFRKELAGVAAIDLDTGRTLSDAPFPVEDWPDAFELVWKPDDRAVLRKHGSPTRVIQLQGVKNFEEATDQALKRFKELEESGEHDRSGAVSSLDAPGVGPWDTRYFAVVTNREHLAVVELIPPPTDEQRRTLIEELNEGWIRWSLGGVEHYRRELPPLVTPIRRLPAPRPSRR